MVSCVVSFNQRSPNFVGHPLLFLGKSVPGLCRMDGNRFSVGKGWPPFDIIRPECFGLSMLDAGLTVHTGTGIDLPLATTARPNSRGRSRIFHVGTSPESVPSTAAFFLGRLCPQCVRGNTPDSNFMKGISHPRGKHSVNCV